MTALCCCAEGHGVESLTAKVKAAAADVGLAVSGFGVPGMVYFCLAGRGKESPLDHILGGLAGPGGRPLAAADCAAFGDGANDVSMLRWAGLGVSMANAESPEVTAAADAECPSVDEDGVAVFVEAMLADGAAASVAEYAAGRAGRRA